MPRKLLSIDDLNNAEIATILDRARILRANSAVPTKRGSDAKLVGLVFLQTSLRTRFGFEAACARLGWQCISVLEQRASAISMAESVDDTLRVVAGMVDVVVARLPQLISGVASDLPAALISGGDTGATAEHPTQALIDLFAIEQELGPVDRLHVAICGDLRFRATRSLLRLLTRRRPAQLTLISVPELLDPLRIAENARLSPLHGTISELSNVDVLYVAGIPHRAIPENVRDTLRVTADVMAQLPPHAIVLSPLPVIDEVDAEARRDPRVRMFSQSDDGVYVRMAVLEVISGTVAT